MKTNGSKEPQENLTRLPAWSSRASRFVQTTWGGLKLALKALFGSVVSPFLRNWHIVVQTLAVAATALFTYWLYQVTVQYTEFTKRIFHSQHEKYIHDVLGDRPFEIEIFPPPGSVYKINQTQLEVRLKNLTGLEFSRLRLDVFAIVTDSRTGRSRKLLVFHPFIGKQIDPEDLVVLRDRQNDLLFNLREAGLLTKESNLKRPFRLVRFVARIEALTPGGVLWRIKEDAGE